MFIKPIVTQMSLQGIPFDGMTKQSR